MTLDLSDLFLFALDALVAVLVFQFNGLAADLKEMRKKLDAHLQDFAAHNHEVA